MISLKTIIVSVLGVLLLLACVWFAATQPLVFAVKRHQPPAASPLRLRSHVEKLSKTFVPRDWRHPENLDRAATYIGTELTATKARVSEQPFEAGGRTYRNVIASLGPETGERIIVGAHYDVHEEFPGADDNASGVAGLIELAALLSKQFLPIRVDLVAYTLEETRRPNPGARGVSLYGSTVHAKSLLREGVSVRVMFSLEMIGFYSDRENSQDYPSPVLKLFYPTRGNFLVVCGRLREGWLVRRIKKSMLAASDLPVYSFNAPSFVAGIDRSDHAVYWAAGYPAVLITDTAFNRNPNYHGAGDVAESLDYDRMAMAVQSVYSAILALAGS